MKTTYLFSLILLPILLLGYFTASAQLAPVKIKSLVNSYKEDPRGPYYRIKWFCEDGSIRDAQNPCPDNIEGIQHASFKESALALRKSNHLYFGEILAGADEKDFLDKKNNYSRLKQYQLNRYLFSVDDGWILEKAQYYRGAFQSEDEEAWGKSFFESVLKNDDFIDSNYYLIRQSLKDIPHNGDDNLAQLIRSKSKILSEDIPEFMDIRIKIHGQPEASDIRLVENFRVKNANEISKENTEEFELLIYSMKEFYKPLDINSIENEINDLNITDAIKSSFNDLLNTSRGSLKAENVVVDISNILYNIRLDLEEVPSGKFRLKLLDITNQLENKLLIEAQNWHVENLAENLHKINTLACAAIGTGLIEQWEFEAIETYLNLGREEKELSIANLNSILSSARSVVEWSTAMVKSNYEDDVKIYSEFEPLAYGFIDDRVRSSVALSLGETVSHLGNLVSEISNVENEVMSLDDQSSIRGLNPGYAFGKLIVVDGNPDAVEVDSRNIYVFEKPPSDLKPVAGIMTVSEGNLVSHVQLLARNLGIPNSALTKENLKDLKAYNGSFIFYAVSNKGNVILKSEGDMTSDEKNLFDNILREKNIIEIPTKNIKLDVKTVVDMRDVDASDSGRLCGPKAANLGELKKRFPDNVVEGLIIPFGVFREHMNQNMLGENKSYWAYLSDTFKEAKTMTERGSSENEVENFQLRALDKLHSSILNIELENTFITDLEHKFKSIFNSEIGRTPVFLRSDTNMEDLKEFTGAGLNLTLFNIKSKQKILEGIKKVWASAYTERSFKWRQKYLSNPENVFPSILIIPSVDVDYSGVMITKGINAGSEEDLTVAFSRGAGGAVDGQMAETRLITFNNDILLSPARQNEYIRLPITGGTKSYFTSFNHQILNKNNIKEIRDLAVKVRKNMSKYSETTKRVYDVEFGFEDDKLWLFQIRPFVENKQAMTSDYLVSISSDVNLDKKVPLSIKL